MSDDLLEKLLKQRAQLNTRVKQLKAETFKKERKDDTRRKILAGAYILHKHQKENTLEGFIGELNQFLIRPVDKILFQLPFKINDVQNSTSAHPYKENYRYN